MGQSYNPLDKNGFIFAVNTLWGRIKSLVPTKTSQLKNDSGYLKNGDALEISSCKIKSNANPLLRLVNDTGDAIMRFVPKNHPNKHIAVQAALYSDETLRFKIYDAERKDNSFINTQLLHLSATQRLIRDANSNSMKKILVEGDVPHTTTSLAVTEEGVSALDGTVGKVLNDKIGELNNKLNLQPEWIKDAATGKITGYRFGGADTVFPFKNMPVEIYVGNYVGYRRSMILKNNGTTITMITGTGIVNGGEFLQFVGDTHVLLSTKDCDVWWAQPGDGTHAISAEVKHISAGTTIGGGGGFIVAIVLG